MVGRGMLYIWVWDGRYNDNNVYIHVNMLEQSKTFSYCLELDAKNLDLYEDSAPMNVLI